MKASVILVGAGSGDPNLLTLGGKNALESCDIVVYDRLISQGILDMIPVSTEKIDVGKTAGNHTMPQHEINELLLSLALQGKSVVRLKGGDNFLFGRGGEELDLLLEHQIPFSVIPGISSPFSASAYGGFPLTHRDFSSSVHIFSGHKKEHLDNFLDFNAMVTLGGTLVFLMATKKIKDILVGLLSAGLSEDTFVCLVEHGTLPSQRVLKGTAREFLSTIENENIRSPGIFFVGDVCGLHYPWFTPGSLQGKDILLTSPLEQEGDLCQLIRKEGGNPHIFSHLIWKNKPFDLPHFQKGDMIVFTSKRGVSAFFQQIFAMGLDARCFQGVHFAVVGEGTRKHLETFGILADFMPSRSISSVFAEELLNWEGRLVLIQGEPHTFDLQEQFEKNGKSYEIVVVYHLMYKKNPISTEKSYDIVVFTSGASVSKFLEYYPELSHLKALCIGETTENIAKNSGFVTIKSDIATNNGIIEKLKEYFNDI